MPKHLPEFPQCSVIRWLVSMQAVHDVVAGHHVLNLTPVVFDDELVAGLISLQSHRPGFDDGRAFLCSIIMSVEKRNTLQFLIGFSSNADGFAIDSFLWVTVNSVQDYISGTCRF